MQEKVDSHDRSVADLKSGHEKMEKEVENLNLKLREKAQEIKEIEDKNRGELENLQHRLLDGEMAWKE